MSEDVDAVGFKNHLRDATLSSANQFDNAILTLSSGFLAVSMAFIKDVVPLAGATFKSGLKLSWALFAAAIVVTVVSFMTSQEATRAFHDDEHARGMTWRCVTAWANGISALLFVGAIVLTVIFTARNI